jgi:hypothetical protein
MNAYEITAKLEKKYAPPSWAFFTEVKSSVGFGRRADGIAVAMWRSLGLEIHGFEVKTSRPDWLRELKNPGKSDEIFCYCNRWWIVTQDASIIQNGELPDTWGLQVMTGRGLKIMTRAPKLRPDPLTPWFVAEILRRHFNSMKRPEQLDAEYQRGFEAGKEQATPGNLIYEVQKAEKLQKRVEEFEKYSGVKIDSWKDAKDIGDAVKTVMEYGPKAVRDRLSYARNELASLLKDFDDTLSVMDGAKCAKQS